MSKIGKTPISLPAGVTVKVENNKVIIQGAKSKKELIIDQSVLKVTVADNKVSLEPVDKKNANKLTWGLHRSLINNGIIGVSKGFEKDLKLTGVGFRATLQGKKIVFQLGFSHDVHYNIPEGIEVAIDKQTAIKVKGIDKELVGKRSLKNIYAQVIDDAKNQTLVSASSVEKAMDKKKKMELSVEVGKLVAKRALEKGIKEVYFDRGRYKYHGRIKVLADSARKEGLKF
ncbi:MAG: 50S ribosomal protein L6 [Candidatus Fonsibacter ubiquis]|nr:50S ribosomal protein L6 [Candidatus Fonsibacter ubiquis]